MLTFDPYDREYGLDPYPLYSRLRDEAPVYHNPGMKFWALTRFEDVLNAHKDAKLFSSAGGVTIEGTEASMPFLIVKDQPEHTWSKALVVKLFSRPRMIALDAFIRTRAAGLLEGLYDKHGPNGEFDFVAEFTVPLPLSVISELLGIPEEYHEEIHHLSNITVSRGPDRDMNEVAKATMRTMQIYMELAADRRANPRDDVVSMLIAEEVQGEDGAKHRLEDHEIAARFLEMGFAGHETVAKAIPNGAMAFHHFPEEHDRLLNDRSLLKNAVDEILRFDPPSQLQGRTTTSDVTMHGVTIPAGEKVMLVTGAATRDPRTFENADRFDITRPVSDYLSVFFGFGVHKCLGVHLARQEIAVAFDELLTRFPNYRVAPERATRAVLSNVRGVATLPITLGERAR
jgi:cytochrome P450